MNARLSAAVSAPPSEAFGRFALRRVLGEGAQAIVWLGFDQRLEREVAIKVMRGPPGADPVNVAEWLREARSVSRLHHPGIVPVFEADVHDGQPYLVFEYVPGPTLSQHLRDRGALPVNEAVLLLIDVLDALALAHAAGVVHRDLKPSNILVGRAGRARVMDFGIAATLQEPGIQGLIVGTPGYMSPEATRGGAPTAAMDVFSAGVMLVEALSGRRLIAERDPQRAMRRVAEADLALPDDLPVAVDDALRQLLRRAIERDPERRWSGAAEFRDALKGWLAPPAPDVAGDAGPQGHAALEFLLRRMRHKSDFPALSDSVVRIQRVADSENDSLQSLSDEILKDVALTNKLLRLVNTAHFKVAGGSIGTVSRAVALVGFTHVRNMAMSLVLLEHMHDKAHANQLKQEFLRSLMAGMLASELAHVPRETEEAFIGAMFQNLGRLLTEYYFPEEARQVRGILAGNDKQGGLPTTEAAASVQVLGLSFEGLGLGIARAWGLPPMLQACMTKPVCEAPAQEPRDATDRMRWLTFAANQIADTLLHAPPDTAAAAVLQMARRYARALATDTGRIEAAADAARHRLAQMAQAMNLHIARHTPAHRLLMGPTVTETAAGMPDAPTVRLDTLAPHVLEADVRAAPDAPAEAPQNAADMLAAGIQDITNTMVEDFKLNEVLRMILETMFRALGFRRVVFCLRDPKSNCMTGRFGLGQDAAAVAADIKVTLKAEADLFAAVCLRGTDTLITDATQPRIAARLPEWFQQRIAAPAFLLLPLMLKGAPFALIYADRGEPGGIALGEKELALLRTLRNQAVMAFKQAG